MPKNNSRIACPQGSSALDVLEVAHAQNFAAQQTGVGAPTDQHERQDDVVQTLSKNGNQNDGQDQTRKGKNHIGKTHEQIVQPAAKIPSQTADQRPDAECGNNDRKTQEKRGPSAPDQSVLDVIAVGRAKDPATNARRCRNRGKADARHDETILGRTEHHLPETRVGQAVNT